MTIELWMLVWAVVLTFVQMLVSVQGTMLKVGLPGLTGNREDAMDMTGWHGRAERAYRNMLEYLPLFAALVLTAHAAGVSGGLAALGAQLFLYARVVHAVVYVIGIPWLRTAVWAVSAVGLILIVWALFAAAGAG